MLALLFLAIGLGIGLLGYHWLGELNWIDSLLNASMILDGMGPVDNLHSSAAKIFASCYLCFRAGFYWNSVCDNSAVRPSHFAPL